MIFIIEQTSSRPPRENQLHIDDYIPPNPRPSGNAIRGRGYHEQEGEEGHDPRRRPLPNNRGRGGRPNKFEVEDYNRPTSGNRGRNDHGPPRRPKHNADDYQHEGRQNQGPPPSDQTFHRERNFTNTNFQQARNAPKTPQRDEHQRHGDFTIFNENAPNSSDRNNRGGNQRMEKPNEFGARRHPPNNNNNNNRNQGGPPGHLSVDAANFERPKRYSNMRSNPSNPTGQNPGQQQMPAHMQTYSEQRSNFYEQSVYSQI